MAKGLSAVEYAELYTRAHADVLRFVARRLIPPDYAKAEDVAHEAFTIAWQQLADIPKQPNEAKAWLFAVARNCLLNSNRAGSRARDLQVRIAESASGVVPGPSNAVGQRLDLRAAWDRLDAADQEVIALTVWDNLTSVEAAQVLGISAPNYRMRLNRARSALRKILESD